VGLLEGKEWSVWVRVSIERTTWFTVWWIFNWSSDFLASLHEFIIDSWQEMFVFWSELCSFLLELFILLQGISRVAFRWFNHRNILIQKFKQPKPSIWSFPTAPSSVQSLIDSPQNLTTSKRSREATNKSQREVELLKNARKALQVFVSQRLCFLPVFNI
jgi:hypothetical protein